MDKSVINSHFLVRILFAIVIVQGLVAVSIIISITALAFTTNQRENKDSGPPNQQWIGMKDANNGINFPHENAINGLQLNESGIDAKNNILEDSMEFMDVNVRHRRSPRRPCDQTGMSPCASKVNTLKFKKGSHPKKFGLKGKPSSKQRQFDILTTTDWEFVDVADNWLESLRRLGLRYNIILVCEDKQTYTYFKRRANLEFKVLYTKNFKMSTVLRKGGTFQDLILKRIVYMLDLVKSGRDVLLADVDAVWLTDPMPFVWKVYNNYDIWIARGKTDEVPCPCFMYLKASLAVTKLVTAWVDRIHEDKKKTREEMQNKHVTDQWALQPLLEEGQKKKTLKVKWLDRNNFPTGDMLFNREWHDEHLSDVAIAHANHQGRHDGKKETLQKYGYWFLGQAADP